MGSSYLFRWKEIAAGSTRISDIASSYSLFFAPSRYQLLKAPSRGVPDDTILVKAASGRGSERTKAVQTLANRNCEK
jgi:hypothetical protein